MTLKSHFPFLGETLNKPMLSRSNPWDLRGKVALITGGDRGIGRETTKLLHSMGASVAVNFRSSRERAEELKEELGERVEVFQADVSRREEVRAMVQGVVQRMGGVDVLVNNAGITGRMNLQEFREEEFKRMWEVNFLGVLHTSLEVIPHMIRRGGGSIVNVSSVAGLGTSVEGTTFYAVTKAAVISLTKRMALELGPHRIRVNAVAPGWIETDMTIGGRSREEIRAMEEFIEGRTMLRRAGTPADVAGVIAFLASEASSYVTGQVITVDGGRLDFLTRGG